MTDIIADQRGEFIAGLRALANFLESNPSAPCTGLDRILVPLQTNAAVENIAAELGLQPVQYDDGENARVVVTFGPIEYHVYGYADFAAHIDRVNEREARKWADRHGMEIHPAEQPTTQFKAVTLNEMDTPVCGSRCPEHSEHTCRRSPGHQAGICRDQKQKGTESCTWDPARQAVIV